MKKGKRMNLWSVIALVIVMAVTGCSADGGSKPAASGAPSQSESASHESTSNDKPYAGTSLKIVLANHNWTTKMQELIPQFESETGIKVEVENLALNQLTQKLGVQFATGSPTPDVLMFRPALEGNQYSTNGWLLPLDELAAQDADYDYKDFPLETVTFNGKLGGIPVITEQQILYYRKDVLEQAGIAPPATLDELIAAAKQLNNPKEERFGFVARGDMSTLITQFSSYLFSQGGDYLKDGKANINSPEALQAYSIYGELLGKYGPPGALNMAWPQASAIFAEGKAVFYTDASALVGTLTNKESSKVADQVGFATFPAGPAGSKPYSISAWALGVNANSAHKDAAWTFVQWATSKEITKITQLEGNPGARKSIWESPDGTKGFPEEMVSVILESMKTGVDHAFPPVPNVPKAADIIGSVVVKSILGEDVQAAADKANADLQQIIDGK